MKFQHDDYSEHDLLGHSFSRDALIELIRTGSLEAKASFTIGVFGEWGTGKTTMLRQIESALSTDANTATVWFNPWQFSEDDNIIRAFFQLLAERLSAISASGSTSEHAEVEKVSSLARLSGQIRRAAKVIGYRPSSLDIQLPLLAKVTLVASGEQAGADPLELLTKKFEAEMGSVYHDMVRFLQDSTKGLKERIVIFIDDLDRCMPSQSIRLLEGMKVLLDIPNFVFVVGVAHRLIERAISQRYEELYGSSRVDDSLLRVQYLDKIFQFSFILPRPDDSKIKNNLLLPALSGLPQAEKYARLVLETVGRNPRSLKRFLNLVSFAQSLASIRFKERAFDLARIVKVSLIAFVFPDLHRQFEMYPDALATLDHKIGELDRGSGEDIRTQLSSGRQLIDARLTNQIVVRLHQILQLEREEHGFPSVDYVGSYLQLSSVAADATVTSSRPAGNERDSRSKSKRMPRVDLVKIVSGKPEGGVGEQIDGVATGILSNELYAGSVLVTQGLYSSVVGDNPSEFVGDSRPVENVSWFDACGFCNELTALYELGKVYGGLSSGGDEISVDLDASGFRLPTEAEWHYLCDPSFFENAILEEHAWFLGNSEATTHEVGLKAPNSRGLYDILGNVLEWCNDWYFAESVAAGDSGGSRRGLHRVCRGGSWASFKNAVTPNHRAKKNPHTRDNNIGFRVVTTTCLL